MKLPHCTKPCGECPFRTDSMEGWLGEERMSGILEQGSFTCHKTNKGLQCAGHMIIKGEQNDFVALANHMGIDLDLSGQELIFQNESDLIADHAY